MNQSILADFLRAVDPSSIARDVGIEQLDRWQETLIDDPPRRLLCCCGRQVGKSTAAAVCALHAAVYQSPSTIVLISPSQRQSVELYRTFHQLYQQLPNRPAATYETLRWLELDNGSRILSLPGSERTVRGIAHVDLLVIDEAAGVDDALLAAVRPMLAVSDGRLFALSTPRGRRGWFFEQWTRGVNWARVSVKSGDCPRIDPDFLKEEEEALGPMLYGQEYCCEFHDDAAAAFPTEVIARAFVRTFEPFLATVELR
jgi:hypothetical protein